MDMHSRVPLVSKHSVAWALVAFLCVALAFAFIANLPAIIEVAALKILL